MVIYQQSAAVPIVTLAEAKAHLRVDYDFEDTLIESYISASTQMAEHILQREIVQRQDPCALCKDAADAPLIVKQFVLCQVGDFFANRELTTDKAVNVRYQHLLDPFIKYDRTKEENTPIDEEMT